MVFDKVEDVWQLINPLNTKLYNNFILLTAYTQPCTILIPRPLTCTRAICQWHGYEAVLLHVWLLSEGIDIYQGVFEQGRL